MAGLGIEGVGNFGRCGLESTNTVSKGMAILRERQSCHFLVQWAVVVFDFRISINFQLDFLIFLNDTLAGSS